MGISRTEIEDAFTRHSVEPDIDIEAYVHKLRVLLGEEVGGKKKIYLDTRYWIFIRDAHLGIPQKPIHIDLLDKLRKFVYFHDGLCPISESIFWELNKQSDITTKRATAALIDELSLGVALCPFDERVGTEIANFLYKSGGLSVYELNELVWLKLSYVLGMTWPSNTNFPEETERLVQKSFTDYMWNMPLVEIIETLAIGENIEPPKFDDLANKINIGSTKHADEITSFEQAYLAEISGGFSLFKSVATDIMEALSSKTSGQKITHTKEERLNYESELHTLFVSLFISGKVSTQLPSLHVHAKCHAAIRWEKKRKTTSKRKIKPNDIYDLHHASAAIGYCGAFFTENPLKVLLTSKPVAIDKEIECAVISDEVEAIEYLKSIIA